MFCCTVENHLLNIQSNFLSSHSFDYSHFLLHGLLSAKLWALSIPWHVRMFSTFSFLYKFATPHDKSIISPLYLSVDLAGSSIVQFWHSQLVSNSLQAFHSTAVAHTHLITHFFFIFKTTFVSPLPSISTSTSFRLKILRDLWPMSFVVKADQKWKLHSRERTWLYRQCNASYLYSFGTPSCLSSFGKSSILSCNHAFSVLVQKFSKSLLVEINSQFRGMSHMPAFKCQTISQNNILRLI